MVTLGEVIEDLVPDRLWEQFAPLLPPPKPRRYRHPGRRPVDDRAALAGIVFDLKTGIGLDQLPRSVAFPERAQQRGSDIPSYLGRKGDMSRAAKVL